MNGVNGCKYEEYENGMERWSNEKNDNVLHMIANAHSYGGRALSSESLDLVRKLVAMDEVDINHPNKDGQTPLHIAYWRQKENMAQVLIELGAKTDVKNNFKETPDLVRQKMQAIVFIDLMTYEPDQDPKRIEIVAMDNDLSEIRGPRHKAVRKSWTLPPANTDSYEDRLRKCTDEIAQFLSDVSYRLKAVLAGFEPHRTKNILRRKMKRVHDHFSHQLLNLNTMLDVSQNWCSKRVSRSLSASTQAKYFRDMLFVDFPLDPSLKQVETDDNGGIAQAGRAGRLAWLDLEMTGNPQTSIADAKIIEVGIIITDWHFDEVARKEWVIGYSDTELDAMPPWQQENFADEDEGGNGLISASRKSKKTNTEVEHELLELLKSHSTEKGCQLAGFSVHCDKEALAYHMPQAHDYFSPKIIDVSTIEQMFKKWAIDRMPPWVKHEGAHRALPDCDKAMSRLKQHKEALFGT